MDKLTDEQLIKLATKENKVALETLVARYLKLIYVFVYHYVHNREDAEDIIQEVFVKMWRNLSKFNQNKPFRPWLYKIAKNTCLDFLKKKRVKSFPFFDSELIENFGWLGQNQQNIIQSSEVITEQALLADKLSSALKMLSSQHAEIISLHHGQELNFREIAQIKQESLNTVKSRYRRAIIFLKKIISQN